MNTLITHATLADGSVADLLLADGVLADPAQAGLLCGRRTGQAHGPQGQGDRERAEHRGGDRGTRDPRAQAPREGRDPHREGQGGHEGAPGRGQGVRGQHGVRRHGPAGGSGSIRPPMSCGWP